MILAECPEESWERFWPYLEGILETIRFAPAHNIWDAIEVKSDSHELPAGQGQVFCFFFLPVLPWVFSLML